MIKKAHKKSANLLSNANQMAREDLVSRQAVVKKAAGIQILNYINTIHDALEVHDIYEFANSAKAGNIIYLEPFEGFDEGVAVVYSGGPADPEAVKQEFLASMNQPG